MISAARARPEGTARPAPARRAPAAPACAAGLAPSGVRPDRDRAGAGARPRRAPRARSGRAARLPRQLGAGLGDVALGRRAELGSTGSTSARIRLRAKPDRALVSSSANGRPAAAASSRLARARARAAAERRGRCAAAARAAPGSRRDREPVEDRLGEIGAGVAGRDPVGAGSCRAAARRPRSGRHERRPGGCPEPALRPLDVQVDPQPRAEAPAGRARRRRRVAKAVVEVSACTLSGPARGEAAAAQAESGPPETRTTPTTADRSVRWPRPTSARLGQSAPPCVTARSHGGDRYAADAADPRSAAHRLDLRSRGFRRSPRTATNSSTGSGKPFSSTSPIGSNSR